MEVFGLGVRIKEEGAATVEAALSKLQKQFTATTKAANDFARAINKIGAASGPLRQVVNDLDATARTASRLSVAQNNLANSTRSVRDALSQKVSVTGRAAQATVNLESSLIRSAKQFAATTLSITGIVMAIRQLITTSDEMMLLEGRINLVADGTENLRFLQDQLFQSAQKTRSSYAGTSELYARVARNADQLGYSQEQLLKFSELTQMSIRTSGINAIEASRGMIQLSQALASGVLRGDEFRAVMEQMPGTARAIAEGLGVPIGALREMAYAGELTAQVVMDAILRMEGRIRTDFEKLPVTIGDGFTRIGNTFSKAIVDANKVTGATNSLGEALSQVAKDLEEPLANAFIGIGNLAKDLIPIISNLAKAFGFLAQGVGLAKDAIVLLGSVLAAVFTVGAIATLTTFFGAVSSGSVFFAVLGGRAVVLRGVLAALGPVIVSLTAKLTTMVSVLGGPVGIAIATISVLAGVAAGNVEKVAAPMSDLEKNMRAGINESIRFMRLNNEETDRQATKTQVLSQDQIDALNKLKAKMIEYNAMLPLRQRDTEQLYSIEESLRAELERGNTSIERRIEIMKQMAQLRPLLQQQAEVGLPSFAVRSAEFEAYTKRMRATANLQSFGRTLSAAAEAEIARRMQPMIDSARSPISKADLEKQMTTITEELKGVKVPGFSEAFKDILKIDDIKATIADGISGAIEGGFVSGVTAAISSGRIADAWKMMSQSIIQNIASAMVQVALRAIDFAKMLTTIEEYMRTSPKTALLAATALLAFAYANGGKAQSAGMGMSGGARGLSYSSMTGSMTPPVQQIIFGATSATSAAGMQPRQAMNVTVIGPNDPSAQRAIQELMTKANSRGRIG